MRIFRIVCLSAVVAFAGVLPAAAAPRIGVVLLHGKTGMPSQLNTLSAALSAAGYAVEAPEMCWSKTRIFDQPLDACMADVDAAVTKLKGEGADRIVVAGMSQGGIAVFYYGVRHPDLAGIVAMAPSGDPSLAKFPTLAASEKAATALVKTGKGDAVIDFHDIANAMTITVKASPNTFLSFHGPDSPIGNMKQAIAGLVPKLKMPVLWISGTKDPSQGLSAAGFAKLPKNRLSRFVTVDADHVGTPDASGDALLAWLATLQ